MLQGLLSALVRAGTVVALAAGLLGGAAAAPALPRYRLIDVHTLYLGNPPMASGVSAINNRGDFVANVVDDMSDFVSGYLVRNGKVQPLDAAGYDLNERGDAVSNFYDEREGIWTAYLYAGGQSLELPKPNPSSQSLVAWSLNNAGQVVGVDDFHAFVHDAAGSRYIEPATAYLYSAALDINDAGVVVGQVLPSVEEGYRAFRVEDGRLTLLSDAPSTAGLINNTGQIAGTVRDGEATRAFLYDGGRLQVFGPAGIDSYPAGMNEQGWIVGGYRAPSDGPYQPFVYRDGVLRDLNALLRPADARHWTLTGVGDINDAGVIVGSAQFEDGSFPRAVMAVPVPEPAGVALMLAGVGVVGAVAKRRAHRAVTRASSRSTCVCSACDTQMSPS